MGRRRGDDDFTRGQSQGHLANSGSVAHFAVACGASLDDLLGSR